ncbi:MAG TPA: TetR/AcrR family transcriptional regulator [Myxococcota bacterium]|nr:TetR/AcrR family transcriptional regulator [Myxococcota bacterium]
MSRTARASTDQRLFAAGRAAFARKGLAGTHLKADILAPARVSVGSFYHRFTDKTDLLLAILREHAEAFRAALRDTHRPAPGRTLVDIVRGSYAMVFQLAEDHEDLLRIQLVERTSADPRVRQYLREDRARWIASLADDYRRLDSTRGRPAESAPRVLDADLLAELVVGLSLGCVAQLLELPKDERPSARVRLLEGLVRFTLGGAAALADAFAIDVPRTPPGAPA